MTEYTAREMMAISAGRLIKNGDILFAGTGVAMLAATVAKRIHAPRSVVFFEQYRWALFPSHVPGVS